MNDIDKYATAHISAAVIARTEIVTLAQVTDIIQTVHTAVAQLGTATPSLTPAVPIAESIQPDYLVCLEDGKKLKMLKRYLSLTYGMSPDDYRTKWGLPTNYPMTAPTYSTKRSTLARAHGLGTKNTKQV